MKHKVTLTITSLLSMLFFVFHWADDMVRGFAPGGVSSLGGVLILVVWLHGTLVLADRVGMTLANLSILKTGKARAIRFSTLNAICDALSCQPGDILRFEKGTSR